MPLPEVLLRTAPLPTAVLIVFMALLVVSASLKLAGREADASRLLHQVVVLVAPVVSTTLPVPRTVLQARVLDHPVETLVEVTCILVAQEYTVTIIYTPIRGRGRV